MSEFLSQKAAKTDDTEVKRLNDNCDIWIHDMEADGVVIDIDNRDKIIMHIRFDFGQSENLLLQVADGVVQVDEHRCGFDIQPGTLKRVIHLDVENIDLGSYDLRYKVEGFVRNAKGELVDATKHKGSAADLVGGADKGGAPTPGPAPTTAPASSASASSSDNKSSAPAPTTSASKPAGGAPGGAEASGTINKPGSGAGAPSTSTTSTTSSSGAPSPFGADSEAEIEEKKVNDNVTLVLYHFEGTGYEFRVRTTAQCPATILNLDCSQSENLTCGALGSAESSGDGKLTVRLIGGAGLLPICRLTMTDEEEGGYGMAYKVSSRVDSTGGAGSAAGQIDIKNKKAEEEAEKARKEAEDKAARIKKESEERAAREAEEKKRKSEDDAAKKKADEEARVEGELQKKRKAEEQAIKDAEDKKKRDEERIVREGEAAKKKKEEDEKKKKADEDKEKMKHAMMEKAKKEAEDVQKREEEKKAKQAEYEGERKRVAADHAAKEETLYGELVKKKLTPFEEREVAEAEAASAKEGDEFARDLVAKNPAAAPMKDAHAKMWKLYAFYKRRYEIEWRLRFLLIERMFWERMCSLCRGYMAPGSDIKQYKQHKVHPECYDKAPKCDECGEILVGDYVMTKGDKPTRLHKECVLAYKNKSRPDCAKCGKKIIEDKWTTKGAEHFHNTCA